MGDGIGDVPYENIVVIAGMHFHAYFGLESERGFDIMTRQHGADVPPEARKGMIRPDKREFYVARPYHLCIALNRFKDAPCETNP